VLLGGAYHRPDAAVFVHRSYRFDARIGVPVRGKHHGQVEVVMPRDVTERSACTRVAVSLMDMLDVIPDAIVPLFVVKQVQQLAGERRGVG
jgi:hypothetical protein